MNIDKEEIMNKLENQINQELINKLKEEKLFNKKLLEDIKKGEVFTTIRKNRIDFYYYNSLLFEYDGKFKTHSKFAFVPKEYKPTYVRNGAELGEVADFYDGYENIKERAKLYASPEAIGVYNICKSGSILNNNNYIVLDIEIAFAKIENEPESTINQMESNTNKKIKQDRIDILLYSIKDSKLLFVEAKHYSNKEIRSTNTPKVVEQIERYNRVINNEYEELIRKYTNHIKNLNELFNIEISNPIEIVKNCGLIIFDFDSNQRDEYLNQSVFPKLKNIKIYSIGDIKTINMQKLYNALE